MALRKSKAEVQDSEPLAASVTCGLVMPISAIDGCSADHWSDVKAIITDAVESIDAPKFAVRLVSDADEVGVIQKRIVQNLYSSEIVVCDVSGKNSNVMFELGMRLAFDKPTIVVKDDQTAYSFDTGVIEHVGYPRDLRFNKIVTFKIALAEKVRSTHHIATSDPSHSTFLKSFGKFKIASLDEQAVPADKVVVEMISDLQADLAQLRREQRERAGGKLSGNGVSAIYDSVYRFAKEHPQVNLLELGSGPELVRRIELDIGASRYFAHRSEFENAARQAIHSVGMLLAAEREERAAPPVRQKRRSVRRQEP